jgi:hypothetical protein
MLVRELVADGLARFLRMPRSTKEDYTTGRAEWQQNLSVDDIAASVRRRHPNRS